MQRTAKNNNNKTLLVAYSVQETGERSDRSLLDRDGLMSIEDKKKAK